ncbi:MAG: hypothetical protein P8Y62_08395, partial [candidate division WOR-3 bacterium]
EQSPESALEEIEPNKLWRIADNFIYISEIEDSSFAFKLIIQIEKKKIKNISIFSEDLSENTEALKEYLERKFNGISIDNIEKLKFETEYDEPAEKVRNEIVNGYLKHIKRRER